MTNDIEPIGKDNNLSLIFGDNARTKIMYALLFFDDRKLSKSEISNHADVSRPTVYDHIDELVLMGIAKEDNDGRVYINKNSSLAKSIASVEWEFINKWIDWEQDDDPDAIHKKLRELGAEFSFLD